MCSVAHARTPGSGDTPAEPGELAWFRQEFYASLTARADALFELTDAVLCADGPVTSLVELTLVAEHRRGHGAMYDALNPGRVEPAAAAPDAGIAAAAHRGWADRARGRCQPVAAPGRPDQRGPAVLPRLRARARGSAQLIPGWPYSFVAALETGRTSWTAVLDAVRLGPADDATAVTAAQLRAVIDRLVAAGHWQPGDPDILIVADAGYDITRLAYVLADLPVELVGRLRSDRVLRLPKPPRPARARPGAHPSTARRSPWTSPPPGPPRSTPPAPRPPATAPPSPTSWDRVHPRLTHRGCWLDHDGELPIIEGTLIRLQVEHLPGDRDPEARLAVDLHHRRHRGRCGPLVAGVPAPLRPRTHLPAVQTDPRLDPPEDPRPRPRPTAGPG